MSEISLIEVETGTNPTVAVIWLHGLGADGSDFEPVVPELGLSPATPVRFIFPNAPHRPVTCNGGYVMPAWYDIISLEPHSRQIDVAGLLESRAIVRQLITRENSRNIPSERIFIAGFSQGGAVAYLSGLTHSDTLAGIIALSTYIPEARLITEHMTDANRQIPVFVGHGTEDDVVSPTLGHQAVEVLERCGLNPAVHLYAIPHSVNLVEIQDIGAWLNERIAAICPSGC